MNHAWDLRGRKTRDRTNQWAWCTCRTIFFSFSPLAQNRLVLPGQRAGLPAAIALSSCFARNSIEPSFSRTNGQPKNFSSSSSRWILYVFSSNMGQGVRDGTTKRDNPASPDDGREHKVTKKKSNLDFLKKSRKVEHPLVAIARIIWIFKEKTRFRILGSGDKFDR